MNVFRREPQRSLPILIGYAAFILFCATFTSSADANVIATPTPMDGSFTTRAGEASQPNRIVKTDGPSEYSYASAHANLTAKADASLTGGDTPAQRIGFPTTNNPFVSAIGSGNWDGSELTGFSDLDNTIDASSLLIYHLTAGGPSGETFNIGVVGAMLAKASDSYQSAIAQITVVDDSNQRILVSNSAKCAPHASQQQAPCEDNEDINVFFTAQVAGSYTITIGASVATSIINSNLPGGASGISLHPTAGAFADPYFFVDPNETNASDFSIAISQNATNFDPRAIVASVPEPEVWVLVLLGAAIMRGCAGRNNSISVFRRYLKELKIGMPAPLSA